MNLTLIVVGCAVLCFLLLFVANRHGRVATGKLCIVCGATSNFGYAAHAEEEPEKLRPMCLEHIIAELEKEYIAFIGRAVVIEPAEGPPCYVFQPLEAWRRAFPESGIADDVKSLLERLDPKCNDCQGTAHYLWVASHGLTGSNFGDTLEKGISDTLLRENPPPITLCGRCCVRHIAQEFAAKRLSYLEVCAPKGSDVGFVIPMGY
jgi:hypothetical protein